MLDIESELLEAEEKFISIAELAEEVFFLSRQTSSYSGVADWLLLRLKKIHDANDLPPLVTLNHFFELEPVSDWEPDLPIVTNLLLSLKSHNCLPFNHPPDGQVGSYWADNDLLSIGFEREAIARVLPDGVRSSLLAELIIPNKKIQTSAGEVDPTELLAVPSEITGNFRGRDSLLEIIAGQAIYIGKISGKHVRATGINKSALAKDIHATLCDFGEGMAVDLEQCRKTIAMALNLKTSLNFDYLNLEGERQFAKDHE